MPDSAAVGGADGAVPDLDASAGPGSLGLSLIAHASVSRSTCGTAESAWLISANSRSGDRVWRRMTAAVLTAAGLSFIGFGAVFPVPELGLLISTGRNRVFQAPWLVTLPGLAIFVFVLGFNLFGDGLRDLLDPRLRE